VSKKKSSFLSGCSWVGLNLYSCNGPSDYFHYFL
jgi:hypothetical protein